MNFSKRLVVVPIAVLLVGFIGYILFTELREYQVARAVAEGKILIDQESHDWGIGPSDRPVEIEIYLRNTSQYFLNGTLVFSVTLENKGIEKSFLEQVIKYFGEEKTKELSQEKQGGRAKAILSYLSRSRKLEQGCEFEPITEKEKEPDYFFNFRKRVSLKPGEATRIVHEQQIPPAQRGYLLKVKIDKIEF